MPDRWACVAIRHPAKWSETVPDLTKQAPLKNGMMDNNPELK